MQLTDAVLREQSPAPGGYRRLVFEAPEVAASARPGQFLHVRIPTLRCSALRRPFSICQVRADEVELLYKCVGVGTEALARLGPGTPVSLLGPLGNGFPALEEGRLPLLVGGGYGVAPLLFLATRLPCRGILFAGGRSRSDLLLQAEFDALGWESRWTTEDGSFGLRGRVTDALDGWWDETRHDACRPVLFACGPDGLLRALGERALRWGCPAWLSLDKHMGCGIGACLACVQVLRGADGGTRIGRVCRDGPVFESREIVWEAE